MENQKDKYSWLSNVRYVYKETCRINKPMKFWLISSFIASLLIPIIGTLLASIVVYILTNNYSITDYILIILAIIVTTIVLEALNQYSVSRYTWENTFVRCDAFWVRLSKRSISCDYQRIEPKAGQKKLFNAFEALDSNWIGIEGMMKKAPIVVTNTIGMIVYMILVGINCPWVLIPMVFMILIDFVLTKRSKDILKKNRDAVNDSYYENHYLAKDITNSVNGKDIRIYKLHKWFNALFVSMSKRRLKNENKYHINNLFITSSHSVFDFIRDGIAYITLVAMVINQSIDVATFTFLIGLVAGFSVWVNGTSENFYELKNNSVQVSCYREFLDEQDKSRKSDCIDINKIEKPISIEFKNVCFTYPGTNKEIIHDLSFKIDGGEKIALVGNNGAGKTTIIKLLCGLYEPTCGEILINNHSLKEYNLDEYMNLLSVVFQDSEPLAFTILENVACCPIDKVNMERFNKAIIEAGLKEKIESLPDKEMTFITQTFEEKGIRLSGGEVQKMMLARALYKQASLLILDEPTAALDPINEEKMYLTYEEFSKGNTSLFISHRLASTRFCNRIFYLENGRIEESGSHEELMAKASKYKEIFNVQAQYYKEGEADVA